MCAEVNARFDPGFWQLKENSVLQFKEVSVEGTVLPLGMACMDKGCKHQDF